MVKNIFAFMGVIWAAAELISFGEWIERKTNGTREKSYFERHDEMREGIGR